ncbi:MAG: adenosine deaminase [Bacilli bacterium]
MNLIDLPKIELHLHLDGSLHASRVKQFLHNEYSLTEVYEMLQVKNNCASLNEYLTCFSVPLKVLQTAANLTIAANDLKDDLIKDHVIYAEVRFAPLLHLNKGLSIEDAVKAVLKGFKHQKIKINLLLCLMRGSSYELNQATILVAKKFLHKGVCGLDLAGAENLYETSLYKKLFTYANKLNIPFTIHAGEASGKKSIKTAISFGASRIGHGINYEGDKQILTSLINKKIALEICPSSNLQTASIKTIKKLPLYELYKAGVIVTVNTDNRTVSNTNLVKEYTILLNNFDINMADLIKMNEYAIASSFLPIIEKETLLKDYRKLL